MENAHALPAPSSLTLKKRLQAFFIMCKPRVNLLIVFTAIIGMFMAVEGFPPWGLVLCASVGIGMVAGAAAAFNCVLEQVLDARMERTAWRPLPQGEVSNIETVILAIILGLAGLTLLYIAVNPLTAWLTLATFFGYAFIYTAILKPATPMNIVIGGASGAMPPVLGWASMTSSVTAGALVLFLIIFLWTPPHFWALACYRRDDYQKAGLPMLPLTHGLSVTTLHILLYTFMLAGASLIPYSMGMSGWIYLVGALAMNAMFIGYAFMLYLSYSDALAKKTFRASITYLSVLFGLMLVDRYVPSLFSPSI